MSNYSEAETSLIRARIQLQRSHPFFARLALNLNFIERDDMPTAGVDLYSNLYYNPEYITSLTEKTIRGLLAHEIMHVALGHLIRQAQRDQMLFNIACDIVINEMLIAEGIELPDGTLRADTFENLIFDQEVDTSESVYDKLLKEAKKNKTFKNFDDHIISDKDMSNAEKESIKKEWQKKTVEAAKQTEMSRGNIPGYIKRYVDKLTNPQINWQQMLYQYITNDLPIDQTYRRPGRKSYVTGVYMPSTLRENLDVTVSIDLSGSISDKDYSQFLTELYGILNSFHQIDANLLYWDTEVRGTLKVTSHNKEKALKNTVDAGGGTTFSCVQAYMKKNNINSKLNIHFTDGWIETDAILPAGKNLIVLNSTGYKLESFKKTYFKGKNIIVSKLKDINSKS
jgi:predicted metal-dependent peptidase